ncbi:MAG: methyl-accepting chemotaxis protein [Selenomonas sp.]|uniref:methyl-accepting chemotaxis protein n=1 Tax=Selenomonas sp. TaxID=2053611 RepID=UPI0025D3C8C4|nr:methyl-accepting chemotaxis protein [Selenomonas sp.]MCR5757149.1 methyl-accepting chemotaxis protein [Selenomonas sp.]
MKMQTKAIILLDVFIVVACVCLGILGYRSADKGFDEALQMKAYSNVISFLESVEHRHPGTWQVKGTDLYKGDYKVNGDEQLVDDLAKVCNGHVTIFLGDTRVATTVKDQGGSRAVNTKCSKKVAEQVLKKGDFFVGEANVLGADFQSAYEPIKDSSGKIIGMLYVGLSDHEFDTIRSDYIRSVVFAMLLIMVVAGGLSYVIVGRALKPMEAITAGLQRIAGGDLRGEPVPVMSEDEIGQLAHCGNHMQEKLGNLIRNVTDSAQTVSAAAEELTASAMQTAETVQSVAESTITLSNGAASQAAVISKVEAEARGMFEKVDALAGSAQVMRDVSHRSQERAKVGGQSVEKAVAQIQQIASQVASSAQVVASLGKRSDEIGAIVDTISNISAQTNLLALNAAIEAARAGEAGRGFSVVADEVRKLAEQSSEAAGNIANLIVDIQKDTQQAVNSIEEGNRNASEGAAAVASTGEAFRDIEAQVNLLDKHIRESLDHIQVVEGSSKNILSSMTHLQEQSQKFEDEAQSISASTEEQSATMHEVTDSSRQLATLAQNMQNEVQRFKV